MPTFPEIAREKFVSLLKESCLVDESALVEALKQSPDGPRAKPLARFLVNRGLLTRFQAQHLLAGHSSGFFLGQYRILELIGRGGMGKVYKAEHTTMKRIVALKVLSADVTRTERSRELFRHEVMAAAKLIHPNIATAFDANEVNGRAFLVLEYVAGPSLSTLVRTGGVLSVAMGSEFIRQAALGLQFAYELDMVHRDIKPSNLLVQPPMNANAPACGTIKIVDFGLALLPTADADEALETDRLAVLGTPDYLSPEQAKDIRSVDIRSDLYSLGCAFYFILTGQVPFPGGTPMEKLNRHLSEEAVPVDILRPLISPGVATIINRLLAKNPSDRFQTPKDLAAELASHAEIQPLVWPPTAKKPAPTNVEEEWPAEDPAHPAGMNISGTLSLAEFADAIRASDGAVFQPDYLEPAGNWANRFWLAMAIGFALGVVLIVVAIYFR